MLRRLGTSRNAPAARRNDIAAAMSHAHTGKDGALGAAAAALSMRVVTSVGRPVKLSWSLTDQRPASGNTIRAVYRLGGSVSAAVVLDRPVRVAEDEPPHIVGAEERMREPQVDRGHFVQPSNLILVELEVQAPQGIVDLG